MKKSYFKLSLVSLSLLATAIIAFGGKLPIEILAKGEGVFNTIGTTDQPEEIRSAVSQAEETEPKQFWLNTPNNSDAYGVNFDETGDRTFLNDSQIILAKALKSSDDRAALEGLMSHEEHFLTIESHYADLPGEFYFVEEASRVKMLNFLISNLEISSGEHKRTIDSIRNVLRVSVKSIAHEGLAKSIAGDQIRLLAALRKHSPKSYETLAAELKGDDVNTKVVAYFEEALAPSDSLQGINQ
ncbi:MAG: hypothetical protein EOP04_03080 [Proteobacteria bacterium]|nr:MAG: hypothetical protein EOP04_03080 [Pseudomonadota bacterium]